MVVAERSDRDLDVALGQGRDMGRRSVQTAELLTVRIDVEVTFAIDVRTADIVG